MAYSATDALHRAAPFQAQVVLLDIGLPEMDGYEVARRLRRLPELRETRLIAVSGYGQPQDRARASRRVRRALDQARELRERGACHRRNCTQCQGTDGRRGVLRRLSYCAYLVVGIVNSAPLGVLSGQRCMMDFCRV
jgi:CheY-like chemotaxis protein